MALELPETVRLELERRLLEQNIQTAEVLGTAVTMRDHGTGALGEELGFDQGTLRDLIAGAFLHDIGKIAIPDSILLKPGRLSDDETRVMPSPSSMSSTPWYRIAPINGRSRGRRW
ncbi:MAG: hypothetical protein H7Z12_08110 [Rhodospirillaceae bacterium]|nr:hypothetical protein [Rhodospirillales bacterium]